MSGNDRLDYRDVTKNIDEMVKYLSFFNNYLNGKKFIVGDSLTIADIAAVSLLTNFFRIVFSKK